MALHRIGGDEQQRADALDAAPIEKEGHDLGFAFRKCVTYGDPAYAVSPCR